MKKIIWVVVGALALIGAGILISRDKADKGISEYTGNTDVKVVSRASRLPGADEGRPEGGETGQGLQVITPVDSNLGGTGGQAGSTTPQELSDAVTGTEASPSDAKTRWRGNPSAFRKDSTS